MQQARAGVSSTAQRARPTSWLEKGGRKEGRQERSREDHDIILRERAETSMHKELKRGIVADLFLLENRALDADAVNKSRLDAWIVPTKHLVIWG